MSKLTKQNRPIEKIGLKDPLKSLFTGLFLLVVIGVFYSTALTTVGTIGLVIFGWRYARFDKFKELQTDAVVLPFIFVFLVVFLSGSYSDNKVLWVTAMRLRLPFLLLPLSFFLMPKLSSSFVLRLIEGVIYITAMVGLPVLIGTLSNYDEAIQLIAKGQAIATPIEHVKYSMFNAFGIVAGIVLLGEGGVKWKSLNGFLVTAAIAVLVVLIHLLSVRTGLVIVYISLLTYVGYYFSMKQNIKRSVFALLLIIILPIAAVQVIPSLKQKVGYMLYDWNQGKEGVGSNYSDSARMLSYKGGVSVWLDHPILGTGYGDVKESMYIYYDEYHPHQELFKLPHSQYLTTLVGSGLIGFILFLLGFYTPLLTFRGPRIIGFLLFYLYLNYSLSFLVENSIERSMSIAYFIVIALLLLQTSATPQEQSST